MFQSYLKATPQKDLADVVIMSAFNYFPPRLSPDSILELKYYWRKFYQMQSSTLIDSKGKQARPPHVKLMLYAQNRKAKEFVGVLLDQKAQKDQNISASLQVILEWGAFDFLKDVVEELKRRGVEYAVTNDFDLLLLEKLSLSFDQIALTTDLVKHVDDTMRLLIALEKNDHGISLWSAWNISLQGKKTISGKQAEQLAKSMSMYPLYLLQQHSTQYDLLIGQLKKQGGGFIDPEKLDRQLRATLDEVTEVSKESIIDSSNADVLREEMRKSEHILDVLEQDTVKESCAASCSGSPDILLKWLINLLSSSHSLTEDQIYNIDVIAVRLGDPGGLTLSAANVELKKTFSLMFSTNNVRHLCRMIRLLYCDESVELVSWIELINHSDSFPLLRTYISLIQYLFPENEAHEFVSNTYHFILENIILEYASLVNINLGIAEDSIDKIYSIQALHDMYIKLVDAIVCKQDVDMLQTLNKLISELHALDDGYSNPLFELMDVQSDRSKESADIPYQHPYPFYTLLSEVQDEFKDEFCASDLSLLMKIYLLFYDFFCKDDYDNSGELLYRYRYDQAHDVLTDFRGQTLIGYANVQLITKQHFYNPKPGLLFLLYLYAAEPEQLIPYLVKDIDFFYEFSNSEDPIITQKLTDQFKANYLHAYFSTVDVNDEDRLIHLLDTKMFYRHFSSVFSESNDHIVGLNISELVLSNNWFNLYKKLTEEYDYPLYDLDKNVMYVNGRVVKLQEAMSYLWGLPFVPLVFYRFYKGNLQALTPLDLSSEHSEFIKRSRSSLTSCALYEFSDGGDFANCLRAIESIPYWKSSLDIEHCTLILEQRSMLLCQDVEFSILSLQREFIRNVLPKEYSGIEFSQSHADALSFAYRRSFEGMSKRLEYINPCNSLFAEGQAKMLSDLLAWNDHQKSPTELFTEESVVLLNHYFAMKNNSMPPDSKSIDVSKKIMSRLRKHFIEMIMKSLYFQFKKEEVCDRYGNSVYLMPKLPWGSISSNLKKLIKNLSDDLGATKELNDLFQKLSGMPFFMTPSTDTISGNSTTGKIIKQCLGLLTNNNRHLIDKDGDIDTTSSDSGERESFDYNASFSLFKSMGTPERIDDSADNKSNCFDESDPGESPTRQRWNASSFINRVRGRENVPAVELSSFF